MTTPHLVNTTAMLIKMANQIAGFFEALPDREEGLRSVYEHIRKFWEPRMRAALLDFLEQHPDGQDGETGLSAFALEAINNHKADLRPAAAPATPATSVTS
ncbi:NAD-dependent formate dehydrogenase subunit delta [Advenella kashmirensis W13003]|uniref:NAD-dependent formate dehydrogenase subunit delta n=1 Tax=Advenella kashmirensis W13003 TaxID=1424334 RepID=V8QQ65_9BURK|nr:formate dehydrogenase subunit delta [Advenella kashmirensis]ETF01129.1 NAD-dependent formate dehydrogenase subunit delta [Advenella kashmirensis W13003]